jgi:hypothetical protein
MGLAIHLFYDQLTQDERAALDDAFRDMMRALSSGGVARIIGDDRAERAINACARAIIESRT